MIIVCVCVFGEGVCCTVSHMDCARGEVTNCPGRRGDSTGS